LTAILFSQQRRFSAGTLIAITAAMPSPDAPSPEPPASGSEDDPVPSPPRASPHPTIFHTEDLFGSAQEIWIEHAGEMYRLRITSRGKLLLTK
jgi:hemin uptake protein HemP